MRRQFSALIGISIASLSGFSHGALISTQTDGAPLTSSYVDNGAVAGGEYSASYANGGGAGFGGPLGNGTFHFDGDATNINIGFTPGANLADLAVLYLDTRSGGFSDAQMNDQADGGRRAASNLAANADDAFPSGVSPDFAVVFGDFGTVVFELNAGNAPGHLTFVAFQGDQNGQNTTPREISLSRALLGLDDAGVINFFAGYVSDSGFGSNESLPASSGLNSGSNIGFGTTSAGYANHNQFVSAVPEPGTLGLVALGGAALAIRRRRPA